MKKKIKQKLFEIQQKMKYEEFKRKTDKLMNQLDNNLKKINLWQVKYLNDFINQKQQTLNTSMQIIESHNQNVYTNYQQQMKKIQDQN
ncbi:unnamed protein product [Paramecium sonneborni]|uniref:Uncharacterized protein n=1 Tax=Paramecium sonneborni TaxID=65129 RepID=A0A8S1RQ46_9CILI|nr:unnamed protein product [Paramecium sonneborni]